MKHDERPIYPNWEAELKVRCAENEELKKYIDLLQEENNKLRCENADLYKDYKGMETEFIRMRAQLDIVYLIFGGK